VKYIIQNSFLKLYGMHEKSEMLCDVVWYLEYLIATSHNAVRLETVNMKKVSCA